MDLSCLTPRLKTSQHSFSLHSSSSSTSSITLIAFSAFFPILISGIAEERGRRQTAHDLQDVGILEMHVHGRVMVFAFLLPPPLPPPTLNIFFFLSFFPSPLQTIKLAH